jgi:hypothetical protein
MFRRLRALFAPSRHVYYKITPAKTARMTQLNEVSLVMQQYRDRDIAASEALDIIRQRWLIVEPAQKLAYVSLINTVFSSDLRRLRQELILPDDLLFVLEARLYMREDDLDALIGALSSADIINGLRAIHVPAYYAASDLSRFKPAVAAHIASFSYE